MSNVIRQGKIAGRRYDSTHGRLVECDRVVIEDAVGVWMYVGRGRHQRLNSEDVPSVVWGGGS